MTSLVGWTVIILTFVMISTGLLYPGYRLARRGYPGSTRIRWAYSVAVTICAVALWILLPVLVHALFPRGP